MALVLEDRVRETTAVTGTNDAVLLGAVVGFQSFAVIGNGNTCYYTIADQAGGSWEVGIGTYSTSGPTLQRTTILASSNSGLKVSFGAGTKDVFVTYPSEKAVYLDASSNVQPNLGVVTATQVDITAQGDLRLQDSSGGEYVALQAPSTLASSYTLTMPVDDGTNGQALITDGNGNLSWSTAASGDVYGPASSTTNAIPTFADTTGKLLQNNSGVTISSSTVTASGGFSTSANLTFTGTANRITGDFSNATIANRVMFQTSTANAATIVGVLPSGTGTEGRLTLLNNSDPTLSSGLDFRSLTTEAIIRANNYGGGFLPLTMYTGGSERLRIDTSGNVGIGTTTPGFPLNVSSSTTLAAGSPSIVLQGTSNTERIQIRSATSTGGQAVYLAASSRGTIASPTVTLNGDGLGFYQLGGYNGTTFIRGAAMAGFADGDWSGSNQGSAITFSTTSNGSTAITERMRITSAGDVGIGTSSPGSRLTVAEGNFTLTRSSSIPVAAIASIQASGYAPSQLQLYRAGAASTATPNSSQLGEIRFDGLDANGSYMNCAMISVEISTNAAGGAPSFLKFATATTGASATERMRIDSNGNLLVGKTADSFATSGVQTAGAGTVNLEFYVTNGRTDGAAQAVAINRQGSDGTLINFFQANTSEGTISVSGTTVSYNGGHLARWSQLQNNQKDDSILKGTVMSNLDDMCVWTKDGEILPNEQLNKMKVSDVEGDTNVAGVFVNWTKDEQCDTDDMNIAMTGDMIIRIADGVVVQKGDLLMSAGDGTAKPQGDDIIRSKTIAKVTSNHVTCTYADGSYCVPCVLMAC